MIYDNNEVKCNNNIVNSFSPWNVCITRMLRIPYLLLSHSVSILSHWGRCTWTWKTFCSDGCLIVTRYLHSSSPNELHDPSIHPGTPSRLLHSLTSSRRSLRSRILAVSFDMLLDLILDRSFFSQHRNVGKSQSWRRGVNSRAHDAAGSVCMYCVYVYSVLCVSLHICTL